MLITKSATYKTMLHTSYLVHVTTKPVANMSSKGTVLAVIFWAVSKVKKLTTNVHYENENQKQSQENKETLRKHFLTLYGLSGVKTKHRMCTKTNGNTKYEQKCVQE